MSVGSIVSSDEVIMQRRERRDVAPDRDRQLVVLTDKGRQIFEAAMRLQVPWVNGLAEGFLVKDIEAARHFVTALRKRLEDNKEPEEQT